MAIKSHVVIVFSFIIDLPNINSFLMIYWPSITLYAVDLYPKNFYLQQAPFLPNLPLPPTQHHGHPCYQPKTKNNLKFLSITTTTKKKKSLIFYFFLKYSTIN